MVGGAGTLAVIPACGAGGASSPESFGDVPAGNVSALSVGSLEAVAGAPAIVGRDATGVYAMTATCTHAGCNMNHQGAINAAGVYCECHGSQFDAQGNRLSGPADSPLQHFAVSIDASGLITVHGGQPVVESTRTAVT